MQGFFLATRKRLVESYPEVFGTGEGGDDYSAGANFGSKWGWYQSIHKLAGGDVFKLEEVTRLSFHKCMTFLSYEKEKTELENNMIKNSFKR